MLPVALLLALLVPPSAGPTPTPRLVPADARIDRYQLSPAAREQAEEIAGRRRVEYLARAIAGVGALLLVIWLKIGSRLRRWAGRWSRRRWLEPLLFSVALLAVVALVELPVDLAMGSLGGWAARELAALAVTALVVTVVHAVMRRTSRWWLWTWAGATLLVVVGVTLVPVLVRMNATPLHERDPGLARQLAAITEQAGVDIPGENIVVEGGKQPDARVLGVGPARLVVMTDGAIDQLNRREKAFLFAHELGHYGRHHDWLGLAGVALALLLVLFAVARALRAVADPLGSLPAVLLALAILSLLATPARAIVQRRFERQADEFGLRAIEGLVAEPRQAAAHMLQRVGELRAIPPDAGALDVLCGYDHPPMAERVALVLGD